MGFSPLYTPMLLSTRQKGLEMELSQHGSLSDCPPHIQHPKESLARAQIIKSLIFTSMCVSCTKGNGSGGAEETALGSDILGLDWDLTLWGTCKGNSLALTMRTNNKKYFINLW